MRIKKLINIYILLMFIIGLLFGSNIGTVKAEDDYTISIPEVTVEQAGITDKVNAVQVFWKMPSDAEPDAYGFVVDKQGPAGRAQAVVYYPSVSGFDDLTDSGFYYDEAVVEGDTYTYYVKAYDRSGKESDWGSATITLTGFTISNIEIDNVDTGNDKVISWETDYETQGWVEYGLTDTYGQTSNKTDLGFVHSVTLTSLTAGQTYHFRIKATAYDDTVCTQ